MIETYEKRGTSVRIERNGRSTATIVTHEHGRATRERGRFRAESLGERPFAVAPDIAGATEVARTVARLERGGVEIERLTIAAGVSEQSVSHDGDSVAWREEVARLHLSLVNRDRGLRIMIELGGASAQTLPLEFAVEAADALYRDDRPPARLEGPVELAPPVAAALWCFVASHPALVEGSRVGILQSSHPAWPLDGAGRRVERLAVDTGPPRSLFRPSYRMAPAPAWFHVRATVRGGGGRRRKSPLRIVALLSPFRLTRLTVTARVLAVSDEGSLVSGLEIPRDRFGASVSRIAREESWFPLGAGAWGSDTLLDGVTLSAAES